MRGKLLLFFLSWATLGILWEADATLEMVMLTYRTPRHMPYDLTKYSVANYKEHQSSNLERGRKDAYELGEKISKMYKKEFGLSSWKNKYWSYGYPTFITKEAATLLTLGLEHKPFPKDMNDNDCCVSKFIKSGYSPAKNFFRFSQPEKCNAMIYYSAKEVKSKIVSVLENYRHVLLEYRIDYGIHKNETHASCAVYEALQDAKEANYAELSFFHKLSMAKNKNACADYYHVMTSTDNLKRFSGGRLLDDILNKFEAKMAGKPIPEAPRGTDVKAVFFAAQMEIILTQIAVFNPPGTKYGGKELSAFEAYPSYGATHIIELHKEDGKWKIRVKYWCHDCQDAPIKTAQFPGCDSDMCDYKTVKQLIGKYRLTEKQREKECSRYTLPARYNF